VTNSAIASRISQPFHIHGNFPSTIALNHKLIIHDFPDVGNITFRQIIAARCMRQTDQIQDFAGGSPANPMDIG